MAVMKRIYSKPLVKNTLDYFIRGFVTFSILWFVVTLINHKDILDIVRNTLGGGLVGGICFSIGFGIYEALKWRRADKNAL